MPIEWKTNQVGHKATSRFIRAQLLLRNWTFADLAKATGLGISAVRCVSSGWGVRVTRRKIEIALGMPIWTSTTEFQALSERTEKFGFDPILGTRAEMLAAAKRLGLRGCNKHTNRAAMLAIIEKHFASQSTAETPITTHA